MDRDSCLSEIAYKYIPVAVFVGGTSGIGQGIAEALCTHLLGRLHVVLVGRDEVQAGRVLSSLVPASAVGPIRAFVKGDVGLLSSTQTACEAVQHVLASEGLKRIDYLVLSAGYNSWSRHGITREELDLHLQMRYYYRALVATQLMPLLEAVSSSRPPTHIMSILGTGFTSAVDLNNLGNTVKPRNGSFRLCLHGIQASHVYTDAGFAHLAATHPALSFTHAHPGAVLTAALKLDLPGILGALLNFAMNWCVHHTPQLIGAVPPSECGEHMVWALGDAECGVELRDRYGDVISRKQFSKGEGIGEGMEPGMLNDTSMKGYSPSDLAVHVIITHTQDVFARVLKL
ncbi:hypothetical protein C8F01DRAFT_1022271 [Mycena amicta]|nr:hypothetical protein C8F01DRAFT_1022271 [Mycena amicta]